MFMLRVMMYVVSHNFFGIELELCDLYLTRFVLIEGLLFDTFFIFFIDSVVVITEYLNSNHFKALPMNW